MFLFKRYKRVVRTYNSLKGSKKEYLDNRIKAQNFVKGRLEKYNTTYNVQYHRISIKNQKTRWGSCSKKGNLNFHYKIIFLPLEIADYIIVHELCHLKQFDHSKNFWIYVSKTIPDYKRIRKTLRNIDMNVINLS